MFRSSNGLLFRLSLGSFPKLIRVPLQYPVYHVQMDRDEITLLTEADQKDLCKFSLENCSAIKAKIPKYLDGGILDFQNCKLETNTRYFGSNSFIRSCYTHSSLIRFGDNRNTNEYQWFHGLPRFFAEGRISVRNTIEFEAPKYILMNFMSNEELSRELEFENGPVNLTGSYWTDTDIVELGLHYDQSTQKYNHFFATLDRDGNVVLYVDRRGSHLLSKKKSRKVISITDRQCFTKSSELESNFLTRFWSTEPLKNPKGSLSGKVHFLQGKIFKELVVYGRCVILTDEEGQLHLITIHHDNTFEYTPIDCGGHRIILRRSIGPEAEKIFKDFCPFTAPRSQEAESFYRPKE